MLNNVYAEFFSRCCNLHSQEAADLAESTDHLVRDAPAAELSDSTGPVVVGDSSLLPVDITSSSAVETTADTSGMTGSLMNQSTCSDNSYVKCEIPSSFSRVDSSYDMQRGGGAPSEFRFVSLIFLVQ